MEYGKMWLCWNKSDPNRHDAYGKSGLSALCPKHKNYVGKNGREQLAYNPETKEWFNKT